MRTLAHRVAMLAAIALTLAACAVSYSPADLREQEVREAAETRSEAIGERNAEEAGGVNVEALEAEEERVEREADL